MASLDKNDDHNNVIMMMRKTSLKGCPIADVCSNTEHIVMTTFDGRVYTCNVADTSTQHNYVEVDFPTFARDHAINIVSVCCGRHHFLALSTDGQVYSWGRNNEGQLGRPKKKRKHKKQNLSSQDLTPRLITGLSDYYVIQIACGDDHSLALTRDGRLFSWGSNTHSQLGVDTRGKKAKHHVDKPMEIEALLGVPLQHIAAGSAHSVVLSTSGSVFVWGRNSHGQLGLQQTEDVKQPVKLGYMSQERVKDISCGINHTSFLKENGKLFVYGTGAGRFRSDFEQWNESELRPWQPDRFQTFSSIRSTPRCSYLVDEINGALYGIDHDKAVHDSSRNLQLNPLDSRLFVDLLEPDSLTNWPPGNYAFDTSVWEQSSLIEGAVTTYRERYRDNVAEIEQSLMENAEQQIDEYQCDDCYITSDQDDLEHDEDCDADDDGVDEHDYEFFDFVDIVNDVDSSDDESFVSCNDDFICTTDGGFHDDPEVSVSHIDEQDDVFKYTISSLDQASTSCPSSVGHTKFSKESLGNIDFPGADGTHIKPSPMPSETVIQHSKMQLVNGVALHSSNPAANPTAATIYTRNATPDTKDTAQVGVSVNGGSALQDGNLFTLEDGESDLVATVGSSSVTEDECPEEEVVEHGSDGIGSQESNSRRTPRRWRRICAGQERIFIIEHEEAEREEVLISFAPRRKIDTLSAELIQSLKDSEFDITKTSTLFQYASMIFSSSACINASFQQRGPNEVGGLNVDLKEARRVFEIINKNTKLLQMISEVVSVDLCNNTPQSTAHEEALRFYFILLECPIFSNPHYVWGHEVLAALGRLMSFLGNASSTGDPNSNSGTLARWWKHEPMSFRRTVTAYREALTVLISDMNLLEKEMGHFRTYLEVLSSLNDVNLEKDIISIKTFYIPDLKKFLLLRHEMCKSGRRHPIAKFPLMSYTFLMNVELKAKILESHNQKKQHEQQLAMMESEGRLFEVLSDIYSSLMGFQPPPHPDLSLHIEVNRDDIFGSRVQEQLIKMLSFPNSNLLQPLTVSFEGEMGIDEGALSIDFFRLVFEELLDPNKNDLFRYITDFDPTLSLVWFGKDCKDTQRAGICGLLLGLSIYNKALVPLPFPRLIYAKLLGKGPKTEMEEVAELDKDYADQMSKLKTGTEEYVKGSCYGDKLKLKDGKSVKVTTKNVHLYVDKMVREYLVPGQFAAFQEGFNKVYNPAIMDMFRPIELEALVMGEKHFDWIALEQSANYTMPYSDSHSTIKMFWKVFHELDDDMKRKFLVFVSGSDRVPVGGLRNLGLTIAELPVPTDDSVVDGDRLALLLPVGHACDNHGNVRTLKLPMYTSPALIEDRLTVALSYYDCPFHIA